MSEGYPALWRHRRGAIHQSRAGVYTGGISIPTRYVHTPLEVADLGDVEACAALVAAFAQAKLTC